MYILRGNKTKARTLDDLVEKSLISLTSTSVHAYNKI